MAIAADHSQAPLRRPAQLALRRERAFKSAKRHSFRVRVFKLLFPLSALAVSSFYIIPAVFAFLAPKIIIPVDSVSVSLGSLRMEHPHYSGFHPTYGAYEIKADWATQTVKSTDIVTLDKITAEVVSPSKEKTTLTAPDGVLRTKDELLTFDNGAIITGTNGLWAKLRKAEAAFKSRVVTTRDPVEVRLHDSSITADAATIYASESRIEFIGNVHVHLEREPAASKGAAPVSPGPTAALTDRGRPAQQPAPQVQPQLNWAAQTSEEPATDEPEPAPRETR